MEEQGRLIWNSFRIYPQHDPFVWETLKLWTQEIFFEKCMEWSLQNHSFCVQTLGSDRTNSFQSCKYDLVKMPIRLQNFIQKLLYTELFYCLILRLYTHWKSQKTPAFLSFSVGIEMGYWPQMSSYFFSKFQRNHHTRRNFSSVFAFN